MSFGGAAGLFLGCSFLSGVEIIYFILERIGSGLLRMCGLQKKLEDERNKNQEVERESNTRTKFANQINVAENGERFGMKNYINKIAEYDHEII